MHSNWNCGEARRVNGECICQSRRRKFVDGKCICINGLSGYLCDYEMSHFSFHNLHDQSFMPHLKNDEENIAYTEATTQTIPRTTRNNQWNFHNKYFSTSTTSKPLIETLFLTWIPFPIAFIIVVICFRICVKNRDCCRQYYDELYHKYYGGNFSSPWSSVPTNDGLELPRQIVDHQPSNNVRIGNNIPYPVSYSPLVSSANVSTLPMVNQDILNTMTISTHSYDVVPLTDPDPPSYEACPETPPPTYKDSIQKKERVNRTCIH